MTKEEKKKVIESMIAELTKHDDHQKKQVGPCIYCGCGVRLGQGTL